MILVCGENLIDFIQEPGDGLPSFRANPGGSPFNTAMALGRQEKKTGYLTPISSDTLGQLLRDTIEGSGVTCLAPTSDKPTSMAVVSLKDGQPAYQFYRDNTAERQVDAASLAASLPDQITALQLGSLCLANGEDAAAWANLAEDLSSKGVPITFDPNIRSAFIHDRADYLSRFERVARIARLIKLSDEDIAWLYPGQDMIEAADAMFATYNPALLVLTEGGDGAWCRIGDTSFEVAAAPVPDLIDTVGAGDTFMANLIAGLHDAGALIAGAPISPDQAAPIMRRAAVAAAINCGRKGCNPPTRSEVQAALTAD